jgi:N-acetylmuramoyl-L-alanine amidase
MTYDSDDLRSMALCIWKESRGEGEAGMQAVASVIANRVGAQDFPSTLHDVIFQKNAFSSMSISTDPEFHLQPAAGDPQFAFAILICEPTLNGSTPDPTKGAHYYAYLAECTSGWFSRNISGPDGKGTPEHPLLAVIGKQNFYL